MFSKQSRKEKTIHGTLRKKGKVEKHFHENTIVIYFVLKLKPDGLFRECRAVGEVWHLKTKSLPQTHESSISINWKFLFIISSRVSHC